MRLHESGILDQILQNVHRNSSKFEVPREADVQPQKKLSLSDIKMIGFILIVGYSVAFVVFLGELVVWNLKLRMLRVEFIN